MPGRWAPDRSHRHPLLASRGAVVACPSVTETKSPSAWEEAACYTLVLATSYRMLFGHRPHTLKPGHNVLVWGASGGLGSMAVQLCATSGANAIGIVSDDDKRDFVMSLGAKGVINRNKFKCWGQMPTVGTHVGQL